MSITLIRSWTIAAVCLFLFACGGDGGSNQGKRLPDPNSSPFDLQEIDTITGNTLYDEASTPDGYCNLRLFEAYEEAVDLLEAELRIIYLEGRELDMVADVQRMEEEVDLRLAVIRAERKDCEIGIESIYPVKGFVEKGPMKAGSEITFKRLSDSAASTGDTRSKEILDNFGRFTGAVFLDGGLVEITAEGPVWDEIANAWTSQDVELTALHELGEGNRYYNVNLLTHLIHARVEQLIRVRSKDFPEAERKARRELREQLEELFPVDFNQGYGYLSIYDVGGNSNEGDSFLLGLSALLMSYFNHQGRGEDISDFLDDLAKDFATDGVFDKTNFVNLLKQEAPRLNPAQVHSNLVSFAVSQMPVPASVDPENADAVASARLEELAFRAIGVVNLDAALDSDMDGQINFVDPDDDNDEITDFNDPAPYDASNGEALKPYPLEVRVYGMGPGGSVLVADTFGEYDGFTVTQKSFTSNYDPASPAYFANMLEGTFYNLYVKNPPAGQRCQVENGYGHVLGQPGPVSVTCGDLPPQYWLGGKVSKLNTWIILDDGNGDQLVVYENGEFYFRGLRDEGTSYNVRIVEQAEGRYDRCTIQNAEGVMNSNVEDIIIRC